MKRAERFFFLFIYLTKNKLKCITTPPPLSSLFFYALVLCYFISLFFFIYLALRVFLRHRHGWLYSTCSSSQKWELFCWNRLPPCFRRAHTNPLRRPSIRLSDQFFTLFIFFFDPSNFPYQPFSGLYPFLYLVVNSLSCTYRSRCIYIQHGRRFIMSHPVYTL